MLKPGEPTPWCNLTPTVYQDSGAALNFSLRHSYHERAKRFRATLEFRRASASATAQVEVIKSFDVEAEPNGLVIIAPPELESLSCRMATKAIEHARNPPTSATSTELCQWRLGRMIGDPPLASDQFS